MKHLFRLLRRVRREKDVIVRLGKLPERTFGECIVVITIDPEQCIKENWPMEEVLVHELFHAHHFSWHENEVRRRTKRLMATMSRKDFQRLTRFINKLTY